MLAIALSSEQETLWTVSLVVGAVVLVVVLALLTFLALLLRDIRRGLSAGTALAEGLRSDAAAAGLPAVAASLEEVRREVRLHHETLSER